MPVKLVAMAESSGAVSGPMKKRAPECRAMLQPVGTR